MRFVIEKGSASAHCCFDWTVVDTAKPSMVGDERVGSEAVCECFDREDAELIVSALNATEAPMTAAPGMVERVARAIEPNAFDPVFVHPEGCPDCDAGRDEARRRARAAIEAMRNPSEAMTKIGNRFTDWSSGADDAWQAMIDAALRGEG